MIFEISFQFWDNFQISLICKILIALPFISYLCKLLINQVHSISMWASLIFFQYRIVLHWSIQLTLTGMIQFTVGGHEACSNLQYNRNSCSCISKNTESCYFHCSYSHSHIWCGFCCSRHSRLGFQRRNSQLREGNRGKRSMRTSSVLLKNKTPRYN